MFMLRWLKSEIDQSRKHPLENRRWESTRDKSSLWLCRTQLPAEMYLLKIARCKPLSDVTVPREISRHLTDWTLKTRCPTWTAPWPLRRPRQGNLATKRSMSPASPRHPPTQTSRNNEAQAALTKSCKNALSKTAYAPAATPNSPAAQPLQSSNTQKRLKHHIFTSRTLICLLLFRKAKNKQQLTFSWNRRKDTL